MTSSSLPDNPRKGFIRIIHSELKATADVPIRSLRIWERKGWKSEEQIKAERRAARSRAKAAATRARRKNPDIQPPPTPFPPPA